MIAKAMTSTPDNLTFTPAANANGTAYATFGFSVSDGEDESVSTYTMTVDVMAVNDAPTGQPAVSGVPQAGQTLTAATGTLADADGLPATTFPAGYTFQWVEVVDGMTETDIATATSSTYTLGANEVGKTVKVKVTFTDGGGTLETVQSDAYPATGTVRAEASECQARYTWCGTMTVGTGERTDGISTFREFGYAPLATPAFGSLGPATFSHRGATYTVAELARLITTSVSTNTVTDDTLTLDIDGGDLPDGTTFKVDGRASALTVDTGSGQSIAGAETWNLLNLGSPPDWIDGQEITVSLTFPPNAHPRAAEGTVTLDEDTTYTFTEADFNFTDSDGDGLASVKITTLESEGELELDGAAVMLNQEMTKADIDAGNLTFTPAANANGSPYATFGFRVNDGMDDSPDSYTMFVFVTAVNDAPTAADNTVTTVEDTPYVFTVADFGFSDVDEGDELASVKITGLETEGDLELDGVAVTLDKVVPKADIDDGKLTFAPATGESGSPYATFEFTVSDGEDESALAYTMTVNVRSGPNAAPTAADNTVTTDEDTAYAFAATDFGFSDADTDDELVSVKITTLETVGALALDGTDVEPDDVIPVDDIDADKLTFTPAANANGTAYATFGFSVNDGEDDSASTYTMTVDVTAVNDAPTAASGTVTTGRGHGLHVPGVGLRLLGRG